MKKIIIRRHFERKKIIVWLKQNSANECQKLQKIRIKCGFSGKGRKKRKRERKKGKEKKEERERERERKKERKREKEKERKEKKRERERKKECIFYAIIHSFILARIHLR